MQRNFADVKLSASRGLLPMCADQAFHSVRLPSAGEFFNGTVDNAITTDPEDFNELESVAVDQCSQRWVVGGWGSYGGLLRHQN